MAPDQDHDDGDDSDCNYNQIDDDTADDDAVDHNNSDIDMEEYVVLANLVIRLLPLFVRYKLGLANSFCIKKWHHDVIPNLYDQQYQMHGGAAKSAPHPSRQTLENREKI